MLSDATLMLRLSKLFNEENLLAVNLELNHILSNLLSSKPFKAHAQQIMKMGAMNFLCRVRFLDAKPILTFLDSVERLLKYDSSLTEQFEASGTLSYFEGKLPFLLLFFNSLFRGCRTARKRKSRNLRCYHPNFILFRKLLILVHFGNVPCAKG
jgi:hypothetical protein